MNGYASDTTRIRSGLKWAVVAKGSMRGLNFLTTMVLARLLSKDMFGLVAMSTAAIMVLTARQLGFIQAYVQRSEGDPERDRLAADTTFVIALCFNSLLFAVTWALSPWVAGFFPKIDGLTTVIRVMCVGLLVDAFVETPDAVLQKRLEFGKQSFADVVSSVACAVISIVLAILGAGVWSLVAGQLGSRCLRCLVVVWLSGWQPRPRFDRRIAVELLSFGKYLWGFAILSAFGGAADRMFIGRLLGSATVGVYNMAFKLTSLPALQIAYLVNHIAFPAFSKLQDDQPALRRAYIKALSYVAMLAMPVSFGLLAVAEEAVVVAYGSKWRDAAPIVKILAFHVYGMALAVASISGPLLKAIGKPHTLLYTSIAHHAILFPLLVLLSPFGVIGIAYAVLLPLLVSATVGYWLVIRSLGLDARDVLGPLLRAGLASFSMFLLVRLSIRGLPLVAVLPDALRLLIGISIGAAGYFAASHLLNRRMHAEFLRAVKETVIAKQRAGTNTSFSPDRATG